MINMKILLDSKNISVRNLHVFSSSNKKPSFLVSFNFVNITNISQILLLHYIVIQKEDKKYDIVKLNISSNILIMNKGEDQNLRLLYYDYDDNLRKICVLEDDSHCKSEFFSDSRSDSDDTYNDQDLSFKGGLGYTDLNGNCIPDIVLSHENGSLRIIEIYTSHYVEKSKTIKYELNSEIHLINQTCENYGAFVLTRINDKDYRGNLPLLDIIVPNIEENKILHFKNQINDDYTWSKCYCKEKKNAKKGKLFLQYNYTEETELLIDRKIEKNEKITLDKTLPTVIRMGDFLGSSNPGILTKQIIHKDNDVKETQISLFERKDQGFKFYAKFSIDDFKRDNKNAIKGNSDFTMGLFYDIAETGTLSFILPTKEGSNFFFFNYRRNIFFVKSKLMNDEDNYFDINLGASFRYIVTDKKGKRHMDISSQMSQTSDMNIPLPYSIMGLDDTNNYVEYFQTISGNIINKDVNTKNSEKNYKENSPIIPNTQMMISKYYNGNKIRWNVDLIVQPMEKIWIFLIIVIFVLLIVLGIIIYLHLKEVKEEQKETNKFKSWFA